jgi:hypothetical protein
MKLGTLQIARSGLQNASHLAMANTSKAATGGELHHLLEWSKS